MSRSRKDEPSFRDYVLAELRAARVRAKMLVKEIETIGVALRSNTIEPVTAIEWMAEANMLRFLQPQDGGDGEEAKLSFSEEIAAELQRLAKVYDLEVVQMDRTSHGVGDIIEMTVRIVGSRKKVYPDEPHTDAKGRQIAGDARGSLRRDAPTESA